MSNTSFFFRGINFEVKHLNIFGIEDFEISRYLQVLETIKQSEYDISYSDDLNHNMLGESFL